MTSTISIIQLTGEREGLGGKEKEMVGWWGRGDGWREVETRCMERVLPLNPHASGTQYLKSPDTKPHTPEPKKTKHGRVETGSMWVTLTQITTTTI